jgi:hypothetical protein
MPCRNATRSLTSLISLRSLAAYPAACHQVRHMVVSIVNILHLYQKKPHTSPKDVPDIPLHAVVSEVKSISLCSLRRHVGHMSSTPFRPTGRTLLDTEQYQRLRDI